MIKKIMLFMFVLVLLVGTVSAFEWDNIKRYDEQTKTITIKNAFGLGENLEKATLISNTYNCAVECKAEKEITLYENGTLINDLRFYRLFTDGSKELSEPRRFRLLYYKDIGENVYTTINILKNGTEIKEYNYTNYNGKNFAWRNYQLGTQVPAGVYQVRLEGTKKVNRIYDWQINLQGRWINEWATWGNISLGNDGEVLLKAPNDNINADVGDPISFNATANITGGDTLTNMSFFDDGSGTWTLNETITFAGSTVIEAHGKVSDDNAPTGTVQTGFHITATSQVDLVSITKDDGTGATIGYLLANDESQLASATFSGNVATFSTPQTLLKGVGYWFMVDDGGATYNSNTTGAISGFPLSGTNIVWNESRLWTDSTSTSRWLNIISVNTTTSTPTFSAQNFTKIIRNQTIWNVQACDSSGTCGFAVNNRTVNVLPVISVFSPTNSTFKNATIFFNATADETIDTFIVNYNGTNTTLSAINTTLEVEDGFHHLLFYGNNSAGVFGLNDSIFFSVDTTNPTLNVTEPFGIVNFQDILNNQTLKFNVSDLILDTCLLQYESSNTTVDCSTNITNFTIGTDRTLTFFVNDSSGNLVSQVVNWSYLVLQISTNFNSSDHETAIQKYTVNVTTNGSAITTGSLTYNGIGNTGATITNPAGDNYSITKSITVPAVIGTLNHTFNLTILGKIINTTLQSQVINETNFTICLSSPNGIPFINITFKNETLAEENINATISSTWTYSLGTIGEVNKTLTFIEATQSLNYTFCGNPADRNFNIILDMDYANDISQQRSFSLTTSLSNVTLQQVLYLLPTPLGLFSPFKTTNINGDTIEFVSAVITRVLGGSTITVATGLTDSSGFATFFLNPNVVHIGTFSKTGFANNVFSFTPTADLRTVVMGGGVAISNGTIISRGTTYEIDPRTTTLANNTIFTFTFNVTSNLTSISLISMNITNSSFHELLFVSSAGVGNLSGTLNTLNNTKLFGSYIIETGDETISVTRSWIIFTTFIGDYSIFRQLTLASDNELIGEFNRLIIILSFMAGILIFMNVGKVIETSEANISVLLLITWLFSVVGWLDTGLFVETTSTGINRLGQFANQYGIALSLTPAALFFIFRRLFIRIPR